MAERKFDGMTVGQLKELLEDFDDEALVGFQYDYGDHWHSAVVQGIGQAEELPVKWSDYHHMHKLEEDEEGPGRGNVVVVLS